MGGEGEGTTRGGFLALGFRGDGDGFAAGFGAEEEGDGEGFASDFGVEEGDGVGFAADFEAEEEGEGVEKKEVIWLCFRTRGERPLLRRRDAIGGLAEKGGWLLEIGRAHV